MFMNYFSSSPSSYKIPNLNYICFIYRIKFLKQNNIMRGLYLLIKSHVLFLIPLIGRGTGIWML